MLHLTNNTTANATTINALRDDDLVGTTLGRWRVVRPLGGGSLATVWLVEHRELGTRAAAKVLRAQVLSDTRAVTTFHEEALLSAGLSHPHIVPVFEVGQLSSGQPWLVMEFLEGRTLEAVLAAEDFSTERATDLVSQLAGAIEYAHARGVLHRDLKPANVMVQRFGSRDFVKVMDFGIARLRDEAAMRGMQVALGSPDYLAPEQINGHQTDARTDVYALGALAWELLVGHAPFWHHPVNAVLNAHLHAAPRSPAEHRSTVPTHVAAAVMKALAKSSDDRFPTVTAFSYALTSAIANRPTPVPALDAAARGESRHAVLSVKGARHLVVCEHTSSAGCFVAFDAAVDVGTKVSLAFDGLEPISGVVVRQFDAHDARRWERQAGVFVEFKNLGTTERVALDGGQSADDVAAEAVLERLRERFWGGAYAALGVSSSATQQEIVFAHTQLDDALEEMARRDIAPRRVTELVSAQAQLSSHAHLLIDVRRRAEFDARRGNWRGVAQCLDDGLEGQTLESLRFEFLKSNPLADLAGRRHAERALALAAQGRRGEAFAAIELALCIDPLRLALHDLRASLLARERVAH